MPDTLTFILICYGCTIILAYGKIFNRIRPKHSFFHCPMCLGFWVGVFFGLFLPNGIETYTPLWIEENTELSSIMKDGIKLLADGCLSSGTSYFIAMIVNDGGIKHEHSNRTYLDKKI
jgi:hypothetical protein